MIFVWILIPCLICGAVFVSLAAWLTTKKGNTISDVLSSQKFANEEALRIEILDKIKISSNIPIVGLFFIGAIVAIALPAFISWQLMQNVNSIKLIGTVSKDPNETVFAVPAKRPIMGDGWFEIPIIYNDELQYFTFQGDNYQPITLSVKLNKLKRELTVQVSGTKKIGIPINLDENVVRYPNKIILFQGDAPAIVSNSPSPNSPIINPDFINVVVPEGVGR